MRITLSLVLIFVLSSFCRADDPFVQPPDPVVTKTLSFKGAKGPYGLKKNVYLLTPSAVTYQEDKVRSYVYFGDKLPSFLKANRPVKVTGSYGEYKGQRQFKIKSFEEVSPK